MPQSERDIRAVKGLLKLIKLQQHVINICIILQKEKLNCRKMKLDIKAEQSKNSGLRVQFKIPVAATTLHIISVLC